MALWVSDGTYTLLVSSEASDQLQRPQPAEIAQRRRPAPAMPSGADGLPSYSEQGDAANGPETQAIMSVNSDFLARWMQR